MSPVAAATAPFMKSRREEPTGTRREKSAPASICLRIRDHQGEGAIHGIERNIPFRDSCQPPRCPPVVLLNSWAEGQFPISRLFMRNPEHAAELPGWQQLAVERAGNSSLPPASRLLFRAT